MSCKTSIKKVIARFNDSTPAIVYEYPDQNDTSTYIYLDYHSNGRVRQKVSVRNNQIVGTPIKYYVSGKIFTIDSLYHSVNRYNDGWDGTKKRYDENGHMIAQFEVKKGIIQGLAKMFNVNGVLLKEYYLIQDSIKDGSYTEFYPNGAISVKATFKNGLLDGMMYYFEENGDTSKYYNRNKGDIAMPYKKWLNNGSTLYGHYADKSEKVVIWEWYNKEGKIIKKERRYLKNGGFIAPE